MLTPGRGRTPWIAFRVLAGKRPAGGDVFGNGIANVSNAVATSASAQNRW
jgi:hypothetical protein